MLKPQYEERRRRGEEVGIIEKEEDILTLALHPAVAPKFLRVKLRRSPW
ncbi:MAG: hypothetical protein AB7D17_05745 [Methanobacteriales archaeon]